MGRRRIYVIMGKYGKNAWEEVDRFDSMREAVQMLAEYEMAFGGDWTLKIRGT